MLNKKFQFNSILSMDLLFLVSVVKRYSSVPLLIRNYSFSLNQSGLKYNFLISLQVNMACNRTRQTYVSTFIKWNVMPRIRRGSNIVQMFHLILDQFISRQITAHCYLLFPLCTLQFPILQ